MNGLGANRLNVISILVAAIAPGISLLLFFYLKDKYHFEPVRIVARMFAAGALVVLPTIVLFGAIRPYIIGSPFFSLSFSAFLEEFIKWFIVYFLIFKHSIFDEPYDGIVYSVSVSLGFATVENIFYAFLQPDFTSLLLRALLPVSAHAMFGVTMGYYIGLAKFIPANYKRNIILSLLIPTAYHIVFNYVLMNDQMWLMIMIPLMAYMWYRSLSRVRKANAIATGDQADPYEIDSKPIHKA